MDKKILLAFGMASLCLLSGCSLFGQPEVINYVGEMETADEQFRMDGDLVNSSPGDAPTFRNVTVYLYTENGTMIESKRIGSLQRRTNVSLRSHTVPEYVIFNSPDFWEAGGITGGISVSYYEKNERGNYTERNAGSRSELPVQIPE